MVGMSGGVDSAAAALILLKQGYDVAGATFRMSETDEKWDGAADAVAVAAKLGIPQYVFDFRELFDRFVRRNFLDEYLRGRTPNPCVACNRNIKFPAFLARAQELGYDAIATGHYARTDGNGLFRSANHKKDQSYVLYNLTSDMLGHVLFPLEDRDKGEIRAMAEDEGLPVAHKPDSQDICFIPDGDTAGYLDANTGELPPGDFVDESGKMLGRHRGITHYTIGQRKGLGLSLPEPMFVGRIDADRNEVVLVRGEELFTSELTAENFNWIAGEAPQNLGGLACKIRYAHVPASCSACELPGGGVRITFDRPQRAVTGGQSAVLYDGERVLGGGIIR